MNSPPEWSSSHFAVNPEVSLETETRNLRGQQRVERISFKLRTRAPVQLTGLLASVLVWLKDQTAPFKGATLFDLLKKSSADRSHAVQLVADLIRTCFFVDKYSEIADRFRMTFESCFCNDP
jgi:hypothetical protein